MDSRNEKILKDNLNALFECTKQDKLVGSEVYDTLLSIQDKLGYLSQKIVIAIIDAEVATTKNNTQKIKLLFKIAKHMKNFHFEC